MAQPRLLCAILAGGEGRRVGGAKPLLSLGNQRLIDRALELARGYADQVIIVARTDDQVAPIDAPVIHDRADIEGPLGGLAAALEAGAQQGAEVVLILPCDMPFLPRDLARRLVEGLSEHAAAAMAVQAEQLYPVCSAWRIEALERLGAHLNRGDRSLRRFAEACMAALVAWPTDDLNAFANINSCADLDQARRVFERPTPQVRDQSDG